MNKVCRRDVAIMAVQAMLGRRAHDVVELVVEPDMITARFLVRKPNGGIIWREEKPVTWTLFRPIREDDEW